MYEKEENTILLVEQPAEEMCTLGQGASEEHLLSDPLVWHHPCRSVSGQSLETE